MRHREGVEGRERAGSRLTKREIGKERARYREGELKKGVV